MEVAIGTHRVIASAGELPEMLASYRAHAKLAEDFPDPADGAQSFFGVSARHAEWPELVVTQKYWPAGYGFRPGLLIVPQTNVVFIGAGARLLAYTLADEPRRLWEDRTSLGFWSWGLHGDVVVMAAEVEIAAWTADGAKKLWSAGVEPPWTYEVDGAIVRLDVMGAKRSFPLGSGPRV